MKQILQNLGTGETLVADVPVPKREMGCVQIQTSRSLVSLGTEKMLIDFGKGGLITKARSQPDKVKQVLQKVKTDGLWTTVDAVKAKLDAPIPLGYCNVGRVRETDQVAGYSVGDRIVSNGPHAEFVSVPSNLTARIPDSVTDEASAFTVVGAIGLQGIRLVNPTIGERVVVSGLGLIGLLAVQILKASGCQVLGIDFDAKKLELARFYGAETCDLSAGQNPVAVAENWTNGVGVDAVLITASAKTDELIHQAATMCRQRGRIVLVGVIGLNLQRADFYEKELSFQVSCSYGPGRYDERYEKQGLDYPIGFVRWTEKRNFEAILQLMADGKINIAPLITHRFHFDDALQGYQAISQHGAMGILLQYGETANGEQPISDYEKDTEEEGQRQTVIEPLLLSSIRSVGIQRDPQINSVAAIDRDVRVAFIGAGGFTTRMLMPLLPDQGVKRRSVVSGSGVSAAYAKNKFGFENALTDSAAIFSDPKVDAVFITTPHHLHGRMVYDALAAGKHVFVEKPLALKQDEISEVERCLTENHNQLLMIGFNRRFSPHMVSIKEWLKASPGSKAIQMTINAGSIPADHWTQDREVGGGRIVGEACHFIDLACFLAASPIIEYHVFAMEGKEARQGDCISIQLRFADGSLATIAYLANGSKDFPKERIEVFAGGKVCVCENFRMSREVGGKRKLKTRKQDKGHAAELTAFIHAIRHGGQWPIASQEMIDVSRIAIELQSQV